MSIWGKLAGAAAELAKGGPIGALLGGGPTENQMAFTVMTI
jgi:DnaJ like chaperone protein